MKNASLLRLTSFIDSKFRHPFVKRIVRLLEGNDDVSHRRLFNHTGTLKAHWENELKESLRKNASKDALQWGDPEDSDGFLGNYKWIKEKLKASIKEDHTVLELGSYDGKWTVHLLHARRVICVDVFELGFEVIKKKYHFDPKLEFYLSKGCELQGIPAASVDFVFSIDTLTRVEKDFIVRYFKEFSRILKPKGKALIALPCASKPLSLRKGFTHLSFAEIKTLAKKSFGNYSLESQILHSGILVMAER